ncbi:alpha/beta fold hydrolase [Nostoc sphaeroides]|uniref:Alpha beta hydrolase n=1 Tax=Nostoc sphaeroides CCNUC1 TaxID=2653204 RepID=A0A5P8WJ13_9NOSO|nr:alpha/beta hydrolase [Nostoc sphaeroides]QFS52714.1 Alpha beta hydrolase [Nostoc sphaeroides CCNUC1]
MLTNFLPSQVNQLTDQKAIAFAQSIERIAQVDKPTLILWGETDDMLPSEDAEKFQQSLVNSQLILRFL